VRRGCGPGPALVLATEAAAALVLANAAEAAEAARRALAAFNIAAAAAAATLTTNQPLSTHLPTYLPGIWIGGFVPIHYMEEVGYTHVPYRVLMLCTFTPM